MTLRVCTAWVTSPPPFFSGSRQNVRLCEARQPRTVCRRHNVCVNSMPAHALRFGVVADVQYGDRDDLVKPGPNGQVRRLAYRESLGKLGEAIRNMNDMDDLSCIVSVGDLIEGALSGSVNDSVREAKEVLSVFETSRVPVHHVVGNHCRSLPRDKLLNMLAMDKHGKEYYHFEAAPGWRFVILNGAEVCLAAVDATEEDAVEMRLLWGRRKGLGEHEESFPRIPRYFGVMSLTQVHWLDNLLAQAALDGENVLIFCHYPLVESATRATHVLLNNTAVLDVLERHKGIVRCVFAGHDHLGGSARDEGGVALHVTLQAMLESAPGRNGNAFAIVTAWPDGSLEIQGTGSVPSYSVGPSQIRKFEAEKAQIDA